VRGAGAEYVEAADLSETERTRLNAVVEARLQAALSALEAWDLTVGAGAGARGVGGWHGGGDGAGPQGLAGPDWHGGRLPVRASTSRRPYSTKPRPQAQPHHSTRAKCTQIKATNPTQTQPQPKTT
jgi:hypothetical protein